MANFQKTTEVTKEQKSDYIAGYNSFIYGFPCPHGEWATRGYCDAERLLPAQF